jgi:hypothetical protein
VTTDSPPPVAVSGASRYTLTARSVRVETERRSEERPLDDPAVPAFVGLPHADLDDGRPLRRAAFDVWAANVRASIAGGIEFETAFRAPRPIVTALAMGGAACVIALCLLLLWTWVVRPDPTVQPTMLESLGILSAVVTVVGIVVLCGAAFVRSWRCRGGSYAAIGMRGLRTVKGGRSEPFDVVAGADHHALLRCTRIAFADGRPDLWVPSEPGALRRLDLILAAADERLGAALRARL